MKHFRNFNSGSIAGEKIQKLTDFLKPDSGLPASDVLGYQFASGHQLYLRPSGTEPKIKFYIMVGIQNGDLATKKREAQKIIESFDTYLRSTCEAL